MSLLPIALQYRNAGLSVIACNNKRPAIGAWSSYQDAPPTESDLSTMFVSEKATQIAIICGKVSGSLEVIDVDLKNDDTHTLWNMLWNDLLDYFNNTMPLTVCSTMSKGIHLYYRCETIEGNQKLASRIDKDGKSVTMIETRGEGGYVIAPPSPGYSTEMDLTAISTITPEQRIDVLDICRKYNQIQKQERRKSSQVHASAYMETPWDAYNNDETDPWYQVLIEKGWEQTMDAGDRLWFKRPGGDNKWFANWHREKRLLWVWGTASEFDTSKAFSPFAIYAILNCGGDFSKATGELRAAGYGKPFSEKQEKLVFHSMALSEKGFTLYDIERMLNAEFIETFKDDLSDLDKSAKEKKIKDDLRAIVKAGQDRHAQRKGIFWVIDKRGKIQILKARLAQFLSDQGFALFVQVSTSMAFRVVKVDKADHLIYEVSNGSNFDMIKKHIRRWIDDNTDNYEFSRDDLLEAVVNISDWKNIIEWLDRISLYDVSFLRDTVTSSYLPFTNGIVHITRDDIRIMDYSDLPDNVLLWTNQIKNINIELVALEKEIDLNQTPVYRFFKRIAGIGPEIEHLPLNDSDESLLKLHPLLHDKLMAFITAVGYMLSNYKHPGRAYSLILGEDTADDGSGGGTGKGLLIKCLAQLRSICTIPGKTWKPDKDFAYQLYKMGDDIMVIEDTTKNFHYDLIYNIITEGLTVEKKNKDALTIPYELSPKIAITTNYNIDNDTEHADRRQIRLLLAKYYTKQLTPEKDLGGMFFGPSWSTMDWMLFYNLLFTCIQVYLDAGIIEFGNTDNMRAKSIKLKATEEFYNFIAAYAKDNIGKWKSRNDLYEEFLDDSGYDQKEYKARRFDQGVKLFASTYGLKFTQRRNKSRSMGARDQNFIIFTEHGTELPVLQFSE